MDNIIRLFTQTDVWEVIDSILVPTIKYYCTEIFKPQTASLCKHVLHKEIKKLKKK